MGDDSKFRGLGPLGDEIGTVGGKMENSRGGPGSRAVGVSVAEIGSLLQDFGSLGIRRR